MVAKVRRFVCASSGRVIAPVREGAQDGSDKGKGAQVRCTSLEGQGRTNSYLSDRGMGIRFSKNTAGHGREDEKSMSSYI